MDPNIILIVLTIIGSGLAVVCINPRPKRDNSRIVRKLRK